MFTTVNKIAILVFIFAFNYSSVGLGYADSTVTYQTEASASTETNSGPYWVNKDPKRNQRCVQEDEEGNIQVVPSNKVKELCPPLRVYSKAINEAYQDSTDVAFLFRRKPECEYERQCRRYYNPCS